CRHCNHRTGLDVLCFIADLQKARSSPYLENGGGRKRKGIRTLIGPNQEVLHFDRGSAFRGSGVQLSGEQALSELLVGMRWLIRRKPGLVGSGSGQRANSLGATLLPTGASAQPQRKKQPWKSPNVLLIGTPFHHVHSPRSR